MVGILGNRRLLQWREQIPGIDLNPVLKLLSKEHVENSENSYLNHLIFTGVEFAEFTLPFHCWRITSFHIYPSNTFTASFIRSGYWKLLSMKMVLPWPSNSSLMIHLIYRQLRTTIPAEVFISTWVLPYWLTRKYVIAVNYVILFRTHKYLDKSCRYLNCILFVKIHQFDWLICLFTGYRLFRAWKYI